MKPAIAIYLQHYATTFIHRQLKGADPFFDISVLCSDILENTDRYPFSPIYQKRRNFIRIKKSKIFGKLYGWYNLLYIKPKLSFQQNFFFRNILKKNNIKLIHAHFGPSGIEIQKIARDLNIPLIVTFHGYDASILFRFKKYKKNIKRVFDHAQIIAVSEKMKDDLISAGARKNSICVIRCGIPVEFFDFVKREPVNKKIGENKIITFLQVSNFVEKKGHKYTLLAFKKFVDQYNNAQLILGGDGVLFKEMQKLSTELEIMNKVKFVGPVDDDKVRDLMINADVFLHHSVTSKMGDQEGIPTVIMEAMSTGLPVISTFHSGIPELITNNYNGILVNEKDLDSYVSSLINLSVLPEETAVRARNKIVENFNFNKEMNKIISLYNQLLKFNGTSN